MANLIIVSGPQAVGKMTVAEALRDKLRYNLMINHDSIEVADRIFGYRTKAQRDFTARFRAAAFDVATEYGIDMIFTYVCHFDRPEERVYLTSLEEKIKKSGGEFYFVELSADLDVRLSRNETPHRLAAKESKRDIDKSREELLLTADKYRMNTAPDEVWFRHHLKIDNSHLTPDEVAERVIAAFSLTSNEREEKDYKFSFSPKTSE